MSGQKANWNSPTSVWRAIEGTLARLDRLPAREIEVTPDASARPLPERGFDGPWPTLQGEHADIGDLVALRMRGAIGGDATGRIVRGAGRDAVECVLGDVEDDGRRPRLRVEVDHLVSLLRKAGGGDPIDRKRFKPR